jgi:hypothetical protein
MSFAAILSTRSTIIKEDFLMSFVSLSKIESKLKSYNDGDEKLSKIMPKLETIIKSFNSNVKLINTQIQTFDFPDFCSFEDYCADHHFQADEVAKSKYTNAKAWFDLNQCKEMNDQSQLDQLANICPSLSQKITSVLDQLDKFNSIVKTNYELEKPVSSSFKPKLSIYDYDVYEDLCATYPDIMSVEEKVMVPLENRPSTDLAKESPEIVENLSIRASAMRDTLRCFRATASSSAPIEINEPTPSLPSTIDVTLVCDLNSDQTLGICCDPSWAGAPIAFTKNENGWSGQVPVGRDWKCVVLQNDQVVKWENANNRRCDAQTQPLLLNVKFS